MCLGEERSDGGLINMRVLAKCRSNWDEGKELQADPSLARFFTIRVTKRILCKIANPGYGLYDFSSGLKSTVFIWPTLHGIHRLVSFPSG